MVLILFWFSLFYCLNQNKIINKLNNEKKHLSEYGAKSCEDLQIASDKVEYLNKIKQKLKSTLNEPEFSVEKAKRTRAVDENEGQDLVAWIQV